MTQLDLFGNAVRHHGPMPARPRATDAQLLILADVAWREDHGFDGRLGSPVVGFKARALDRMVGLGWLRRTDLGDPDLDGGRLRIHITSEGRKQLAMSDACDDWAGATRVSTFVHYAGGTA